ncbi:class I SAM-dependent methyltransferase [Desulfobacula sp.]|uniref:class I SAM-dependent methyltransferase n=1 Tax=Desulfobacula sp. TaxID=2593537 RepID=UPI002624253D|nr:class I SAM-dependent methyltransferase [Desulfobacula sp.]
MNTIKSNYCCPACEEKTQFLINWEYSGLNDSIFNYMAKIYECLNCGLVYIANISAERLSVFYNKECSYFEKPHFNISAPENIIKYKFYKEIIVNAGLTDTPVTDIGCGRGGFLLWLKNNDWNGDCQGIDIDLKSIPDTGVHTNEQSIKVTFQEGRAVAMPFEDGTQSLLTYFHVLEHICNIDKVFREAFRVLNESGHIIIEVPDAERYKDFPVGTAFWLSIREHVNHFSPDALCKALQRNGFEVISINRGLLPTPEFSYPSLIVLARKGNVKRKPNISKKNSIASFFIQSNKDIKTQAQKVSKFCSKFSRMTFWGCSAELFSLLPIMNLQDFTLCDSSKIKQQCVYKGLPVNDPAAVKNAGALIVAPYLHGSAIEKTAIELGWSKETIFRLR